MRVAVRVALGDLPVVRTGVARRARVGQHDAAFELAGVDVETDACNPRDAELNRRHTAVEGGTVVLHAGRDADRLTLDVHRDLKQTVRLLRCLGPSGRRPAGGDRQRRRAGDAGPGRRLAPRNQRDVLEPVVARDPGEQRQISRSIERRPMRGHDRAAGIDRAQLDSAIGPRLELRVRAKADRGVQRDGAVVEKVERPDVDGAAGQVDTRRGGRNDPVHCPEL